VRQTFAKVIAAALTVGLLAGCGGTKPQTPAPAAPQPAADTKTEKAPVTLKIGQIPTIDGLPFWVADQKGYYQTEGVNVELVTFKSANERDAAIMSGAIDGMLADPIASATLLSSGTKIQITSLALGATQQEGPIAIVAAPNSGITDVTQLKGQEIGISTNSIMQFVAEKLLEDKGVKPDEVKLVNTPNIPVRFESLMSGQLKAAILPDPLLSLALAKGAKLLYSDVDAKVNLSLSVIPFTQKAIQEKADGITRFFKAYNHAVADIKANPNSFKDVLVKQANLPQEIVQSFQVVPFSPAQAPKQEDMERVLTWLTAKNLLKNKVTYQDLVNATLLPKQ
jgi:NitT/TauT family transport system substrate-binding protein